MTAPTATHPTSALTVTPTGEPWVPKDLTAKLEAFPERDFNLLLPTTQVRQVNPYLVPDIEVVQLTEDDIYHSNDMKEGQFAPTAKGLAKLAQVAGLTQLDSRRMDDGKDPDVVEWRVEVEMTTPSGRTVRGFGSKEINLTRDAKGWTGARMAKAREHLHQMAETKAFNRAVRSLLSLHGSYPKGQLLKPFAVLRYVPDMSQPEVRQAFLGQLLPSTEAAFGPAPAPQLTQQAEVEVAPEAPEDDPAPEAAAAADDEPDWTKTSEDAKDEQPRILTALVERASASEVKGPATEQQRGQLKVAMRGIGQAAVMAVLGHAFSIAEPGDITAAQAHAVLDEFESRGATFANAVREAADWVDRSLPDA